jgi:hypothetical protein
MGKQLPVSPLLRVLTYAGTRRRGVPDSVVPSTKKPEKIGLGDVDGTG